MIDDTFIVRNADVIALFDVLECPDRPFAISFLTMTSRTENTETWTPRENPMDWIAEVIRLASLPKPMHTKFRVVIDDGKRDRRSMDGKEFLRRWTERDKAR